MFWVAPLIMAAAAAAQGIAGAASSKAQADQAADQAAQDRALQERLAKQQLEEQKRQREAAQLQQAQGNLVGAYNNAAETATGRARENEATTSQFRDALARAFLGGR